MKYRDGYFTFMDGISLEDMHSDSCARYVLFNILNERMLNLLVIYERND